MVPVRWGRGRGWRTRRARGGCAAIADVLEARLAADGSAEREQWCLDNWDAVAAEVAAAQTVSLGVASHQLMIAMALRERLPRVAEVFAAGQISYRLVNAIVHRTALIADPAARAKVDAELAAEVIGLGARCRWPRAEAAIDYWVDRYDPYAVRAHRAQRARPPRRRRRRQMAAALSYVEAQLFGHDAAALDKRLDAMARGGVRRPIRAPSNSAAPTRWARWPTAVTGWPASAVTRPARRRLRHPVRWWST